MYQLDTDVIIYHFRKRQSLSLRWLVDCSISSITYAELMYGAQKSIKTNESRMIIRNFIKDFEIKILPVTTKIAEEYAVQKRKLEVSGKQLDDFDLLIGTTAICHDNILVTNNVKHFSRMQSLTVETYS